MASEAGNNVDPTMYQDPTKLSFHSKSEKYCINCGRTDELILCSRCKSAWYCDSDCQQADWPCHGILCEKYAKLNESEPIKNGYLAFVFCANLLEPMLLVLPVTSKGVRDYEPITRMLRNVDGWPSRKLEFPGIGFNMRLKKPIYTGKIFLGLQAICRECNCFDLSEPNKAIFATVKKTIGKEPPHPWMGNVIVRRQHDSRSGLKGGSVTMADFRHVVDWLAVYPQKPGLESWDLDPHGNPPSHLPSHLPSQSQSQSQTQTQSQAQTQAQTQHQTQSQTQTQSLWSPDSFPSIDGVQIAANHQIRKEWERYYVVPVHAGHPIRGLMAGPWGSISPISKLVGRPLRLVLQVDQIHEGDANYVPPTCDPAKALMRSIENDTSSLPPELASGPSPGWCLPHNGRILVVRVDDENLSVEDVEAMTFFCHDMCHEVLRDVELAYRRDDKPELEVAIQRARDFMTQDNYHLAFDKLGKPRPQRGQ